MTDQVVIAILAKQKAHCLPLYLECLERQTYPKDKIHIYVRTNNNTDNTRDLLFDWISRVKSSYASVYFDDSDVHERVQDYAPHEWNNLRFTVLGNIRQQSIEYAKKLDAHYFVVDCDNFINSNVLEIYVKLNIPAVVAPMLNQIGKLYSNYHHEIDDNGFYKESPTYYTIHDRSIKGLILCGVVHCTYFIHNSVLKHVDYQTHPYNTYEYVIFSSNLRKAGVLQLLDNREFYGYISFCTESDQFEIEKTGFVLLK